MVGKLFPELLLDGLGTQCMIIMLLTLHRCWSYVGMIGGRQDISIAPGCTSLIPVHEIFHALGRWHEQSRPDRDNFVTVNLNNVPTSKLLLLVMMWAMHGYCHYFNTTYDPILCKKFNARNFHESK